MPQGASKVLPQAVDVTNAHCVHLNLFDESDVEDCRQTVLDSDR